MNLLAYFVYWILSRDFSTTVDLCRNNITGKNGFCLFEWTCNTIAKDINIGSCDNANSSDMCCYIRLKYGNQTQGFSSFIPLKTSGLRTNRQRVDTMPTNSRHFFINEISSRENETNSPSFSDNGNQWNQSKFEIPADDKKFVTAEGLFTSKKRYAYEKLVTVDKNHKQQRSFLRHVPFVFRRSVLNHKSKQLQRPVPTLDENFLLSQIKEDNTLVFEHPIKTNKTHSIQRPFRTHEIGIIQRSLQLSPSHDIRRPALPDPTHDLKRPALPYPIHDLRKPSLPTPTHDLGRSVLSDPTHDLRRPVVPDPTHDLRKSVLPDHDLRRPVALVESHDLRWPVIDESGYDNSESAQEFDIFRSGNAEKLMNEIFHQFKNEELKNDFIDKKHPIYEILYEDKLLKSNCTQDYMFTNESTRNNEELDEQKTSEITDQYKDYFKFVSEVCGVPFNESTTESVRKGKHTEWPWMVSLQRYFKERFWHICGASLLNDLWVITAAHCVALQPKWDFKIQLGKHNIGHHSETHRYVTRFVDRIVIHPKFNDVTLEHDIALLRMESPIDFQPDIVPICLPRRTDELDGKMAVALGWRLVKKRKIVLDRLQEMTIPVITNSGCKVTYKTGDEEDIDKTFICLGNQYRGHASCNGTSGGPLALLDRNGKWILIGLVSWGKLCSSPNHPHVYIGISRYSQWIEDTIACYEYNIKFHGMV